MRNRLATIVVAPPLVALAIATGVAGASVRPTEPDGSGRLPTIDGKPVRTVPGVRSQHYARILAPGDDCADPFTPALVAGAPTASGDTTLAPYVGAPFCEVPHTAPGHWYTYVNSAPGPRLVTLDTEGAGYDTQLTVYSGDCANLVCVAGDNDGGAGTASKVNFCAVPGVEYRVLVHGFGAATGTYKLSLDDTIACGANDMCDDAVDLALPPGGLVGVLGETLSATVDGGASTCAGVTTDAGVWYTVTGNGNRLDAETTVADYDTRISVYRDGCGTLACVTADDDSGSGPLTSRVSWCGEPGVEYHILVHGPDPGGTFNLEVADDGVFCADGACCLPGPSCSVATAADCATMAEVFNGIGTTCAASLEYEVVPAIGSFLDIRVTGTRAPNASTVDDIPGDVNIPIGFTFPFFGVDHAETNISQNGYVTFQVPPLDYTPDAIPNTQVPNDYIAPLWGDFDPREVGDVYWENVGGALFIVQWTELESFFHLDNDDRNTFQVQLSPDGCIEFHYGTFTNPPIASTHVGTPYVTGIEDASGAFGYAFDTTPPDFGDTPSRLCPLPPESCEEPAVDKPNLLRNAEWPAVGKAAIFVRKGLACLPLDPVVSLDPGGADCIPDPLGSPGDADDDTYVLNFAPSSPDPQPSALLPAAGSLLFYQVDDSPSVANRLRLSKQVDVGDPSGYAIVIDF